jgi:predicted DCC family thiol-disulfide oxidoreductase YuxK
MTLPPNVKADDRVILFDGVCKLCNAWSNFIIRNDETYQFKLCSVQSLEGQKILRHFGFPTDHFETILYVEGDKVYQKSDAYLKIVNILGYPWRLTTIFRILPEGLRDWFYDRVALNRYRLFGKYDYCQLPMPDHDKRYISEH